MTIVLSTSAHRTHPNRTIKFVQSGALLATSVFLFRSGMAASLSNLFAFHPNAIAAIWGNLATVVAFLLIPTAFAVFTSLRPATLAAIVLLTLALSIYLAQTLLVFVDKISDQTYLLLNLYLKEINPIFPLVVSLIALTISILRLKTYQIS